MSDPFIGEIRIFAGNYAPAGWALCTGQLLAISEYEALYALIGTTYGGDGESNFALPDFRGRVPIHRGRAASGSFYALGQTGGVEQVQLTSSQMPGHTHQLAASSAAPLPATTAIDISAAGGSTYVPASPLSKPRLYADAGAGATVPMAAAAIGVSGGSQPHNNMAPFMAINYIISLFGIFPSNY